MPHHEGEEGPFIREEEEVLWLERKREEGLVRERAEAEEAELPPEERLLRSA